MRRSRLFSTKDAELARSRQALAAAEAIIQQSKEALRLERIRKYGKQSEKLSDLQLQLLDLEPAVSSEEVETEIASGPLSEERQEHNALPGAQQQKKRKPIIPAATSYPRIWNGSKRSSLARLSSAPAASAVGETKVIGYEETEVLGRKPAVYFVTRDHAREARMQKLRRQRCNDRADAGAHRAQIDLRRRSHHQFSIR